MTRAKPALRIVGPGEHGQERKVAVQPSLRGYAVLYRGAGTSCPGCQGTNWHVGRCSAECGRCGTALPLGGLDG